MPVAQETWQRGIRRGIGFDEAEGAAGIAGTAQPDNGRAGGAQFAKKGGDGSGLGLGDAGGH